MSRLLSFPLSPGEENLDAAGQPSAPALRETESAGQASAPVDSDGHEGPVSYERLRDRAHEAAASGELERAEELLTRAETLARHGGDPDQISMAVCNRAAVAIELGRGGAQREALREVLTEAAGEIPCTLAAYHLARTFELEKQFKKALFYARLARDHALQCEAPEYKASAYNLLGNVLLADSEQAKAIRAYERALDLMPEDNELQRARVLDNMGYCRVLEARFDEAFTLLYQSLRTLRRHGAWGYCTSTHLDLCFAHLEKGRLRHARRHGEQALELALRFEDDDSVRNALYLLGEVANQEGDEAAAFAAFEQLQQRYYPDDPNILHLLMAVDMRSMVNLRA